jgi:hypothetical protein
VISYPQAVGPAVHRIHRAEKVELTSRITACRRGPPDRAAPLSTTCPPVVHRNAGQTVDGHRGPGAIPDRDQDRPIVPCRRALSAYARTMGRTILNIIGILLAIWLFFTVLGMLVAALKFLIWIGVLAVVGAIIVAVISKMAKS